MYYGNRLSGIKWALVAGIAVGIFFASMVVMEDYFESRIGSLLHELSRALPFGVVFGLILPLAYLVTCLFGVRVANGRIQRVFCRRLVLQDRSLLEMTRVSGGSSGTVELRFVDGSKLRFGYAHLTELDRFASDMAARLNGPMRSVDD